MQTTATKFEMIPVKSSNLKAIGYDARSRTLRIQFHDRGATYDYQNVPAQVYSLMMLSNSVGTFFSEVVKPHFKATRVSV